MAALGVLSNDHSHTFRQAIESAAHVRYFAGHPDPRSLRTIHRLQTWQPDHSAASTTTNNARTCSASNPGLTTRLRPFLSRISTLASPGVLGPCPATCTSRNFVGVCSSSRFFHTKKYGRHKPCSRQNAFTLCPLHACSETSLRHFVHAFFERLVMSQHCNATRIFTRWGSLSAHGKGVTVVRFKAETTPKSFQGKIKVAVTLGGATKGIDIKDSEPKDYIAELTVIDP